MFIHKESLRKTELELRDKTKRRPKGKFVFTLIVNADLNVIINGFNEIAEQTDSSDTSSND